jgi:hypothetical protein
VALGSVPGYAAGKPDKPAKGGQSALAADAGAGNASRAVSPAVSQASSAIQSRIVNYARAHQGEHTFGSYVDQASGKVVVETDAPSDVVSSLVGTVHSSAEAAPAGHGHDHGPDRWAGRRSRWPAHY